MILNFQQCVHLQPTISAVPVVRGEWSEYRRYELTPSLNGYACLECGNVEQRKTNFCPNCGAKMEDKS